MDDFLDKLIRRTFYHDSTKRITWKFKERNNNVLSYYAIIKTTKKKCIYLVLTRRKLSYTNKKINIYLSVYISTKNKDISVYDKVDKLPLELSKDFNYKLIRTLFISRYDELFKLYVTIKYNYFVDIVIGRDNYIKNLIEWSNNGSIKWTKSSENLLIFDDVEVSNKRLSFHLYKEYLYIKIIYNNNHKSFIVNSFDISKQNLYSIILETIK